ncbi:MAG: serine hydrolase, partial [Oscillospiraceae bacterium]|nr:serine hydrolase [Oscillospiraceae bacterium]
MKMQISEFARLCGVSVRTLQYYDSVGILKPTEVSEKGYRLYDKDSVSDMRKILQYKRLGFSLNAISKLISDKDGVRHRGGLLAQKRKLTQEIKRLTAVVENIDRELAKPVKIDNWFDKINRDYNHSSCHYTTAHGEDFVTYGKADYENDLDFTTSSRFPLGSLTTQFTAYCIIRFQELGLLRTVDNIGKYFAEIICGDKMTIHQLLNMTSGLSDDYFQQKCSEDWNNYCEKVSYNDLPYEVQICHYHKYNKGYCKTQSVSEIIKAANFTPLKFVPGEKFDWANINYLLLRIILEKISQKSLKEIMDDYIFTPLEMDNTALYGCP